MPMETITTLISEFLAETGHTQKALADMSGVPASTICNLLHNKRKDVTARSYFKLQNAMRLLRNTEATPHA